MCLHRNGMSSFELQVLITTLASSNFFSPRQCVSLFFRIICKYMYVVINDDLLLKCVNDFVPDNILYSALYLRCQNWGFYIFDLLADIYFGDFMKRQQ